MVKSFQSGLCFPTVLHLCIHCDFERGSLKVKQSRTLQMAFYTHKVAQSHYFCVHLEKGTKVLMEVVWKAPATSVMTGLLRRKNAV